MCIPVSLKFYFMIVLKIVFFVTNIDTNITKFIHKCKYWGQSVDVILIILYESDEYYSVSGQGPKFLFYSLLC
jgi:hypothetical protein